MSFKDPKNNSNKNQESQNENGKVLNFPSKKNFSGNPAQQGDKGPLRLVEPPHEAQPQEYGQSPEMKSKWSRSMLMKSGFMFAFMLGVIMTSQFNKFFVGGGRQIASDENTMVDEKAEQALIEKINSNREPSAEWSLNVVPKEDQFRHGYLRGNYQITHELSTGLLLSVEYAKPSDSSRAPRDFTELSREEFFNRYASLWVQDYTGFEKLSSSNSNGFIQETYKLKTKEGSVVLDFKLDNVSRLLAIKRAIIEPARHSSGE